jgi:hypothetical protein
MTMDTMPGAKNGKPAKPLRFTLWAARRDGVSERTVQELVFIGEHVPRLKELIRARITCFDKGGRLARSTRTATVAADRAWTQLFILERSERRAPRLAQIYGQRM